MNVIKGEMSLVGPRPVPAYEVELYDDWHYQRLAGPPGITGIWQVYGRSRVTFEEMVQMDIDYVRRSSIVFDIKLLLLTVTAVVFLKGAA
jgi:lipopolysaccharide/colanic/teichoic acid biosynthesis glycosyltransferase